MYVLVQILLKEKLVITMNKIAKILSVVLSVSLVVGVTVAMLVSAFAANAPTFSLGKVSENDKEVVISVSLDEGSASNFDFQLTAKEGYTLTSIDRSQAFKNFIADSTAAFTANPKNGKVGGSFVPACNVNGVLLTFTFTKASAKEAAPSDFSIVFETCGNDKGEKVTPKIVNNIPEPATEKPTEKPTEAPTSAADGSTTKADDDATTVAPDTTTAADSANNGDVVNPETGDRLTATAAVVSLLAISGAAVVALRKKED